MHRPQRYTVCEGLTALSLDRPWQLHAESLIFASFLTTIYTPPTVSMYFKDG